MTDQWQNLIKYLRYPLLLLTIIYVYVIWDIYSYALQTTERKADVAIVMGASLWGKKPSPVFKERIHHAISLYKDNKVGAVIFTGGGSYGGGITESESAQHYAIQFGVAAADIFIDTVSSSSYENLLEAKKIMQQEGYSDAIIVSDPLHMRRIMSTAKMLSMQSYPSPTPSSRYQGFSHQLLFLLQEGLYYPAYLLLYS